jgi:hypothetical protein
MWAVALGLNALLVSSEMVFRLWLRHDIDPLMIDISYVLTCGLVLGSSAYPAYAMLEASNQSYKLFKVYRITSPIYLIILIFVIFKFGMMGAACAWAGRLIIDSVCLNLIAVGIKNTVSMLTHYMTSIIMIVGISLLGKHEYSSGLNTRIFLSTLMMILALYPVWLLYQSGKRLTGDPLTAKS